MAGLEVLVDYGKPYWAGFEKHHRSAGGRA